jgi:hypothetical protein
MDSSPRPGFVGSRGAMRIILLINFTLLGLFVIPPAHRWVDRLFLAMRAIHSEQLAGRSLQIWILGSTVLATALFGWMVWKQRKAMFAGISSPQLSFEGILLLPWWVVLLGICAYGFALGMGG